MKPLKFAHVVISILSFLIASQSFAIDWTDLAQNEPFQCLYAPSSEKATNTVLIAHGINIKPSKMHSLIEFYHSNNFNVVFVVLEGHVKESTGTMPERTQPWFAQVQYCAKKAKTISYQEHTSLDFVGYSMGGLLGMRLLQENPTLFRHMELFAPALAIRKSMHLVRMFWKSFSVPSLSEVGYSMHSFVSAERYHHLFEIYDEFHQKVATHMLSTASVNIYLHPNDPLIDWKKLHALRHKNSSIHHWQIFDIRKIYEEHTSIGTKSLIKHLIIDEHTLGSDNWQRLLNKLKTHFPTP